MNIYYDNQLVVDEVLEVNNGHIIGKLQHGPAIAGTIVISVKKDDYLDRFVVLPENSNHIDIDVVRHTPEGAKAFVSYEYAMLS